MKKILSLALILVLAITAFTGCSNGGNDDAENNDASGEMKKIVVGATPVPHSEILAVVKDTLAEQGYELEVTEFTDYVIPNTALEEGSLDANFFQHIEYLNDFNEKRGTHLVSVFPVHYEPFGLYAGKISSIDELADGGQIAVPNDPTNEARALLLLQAQGLITLSDDAGTLATVTDIAENPKNLTIVELEAAQIPRSLEDVDLAVINGNYALQAGMSIEDAIALEDKESFPNSANPIVVREGDENREEIQALVNALNSDAVRDYINSTYNGAVVPVF